PCLAGRPGINGLGSVGTYGSGLTLLVAVPLPGRISRPLRDQVTKTPGATRPDEGVRLAVGPLSLLLTDSRNRRSWLLTGTVTPQTLDAAAAALAAPTPGGRPPGRGASGPSGGPSGTGRSPRWTGSSSTCRPATSTASSARTAPARPRPYGCCSGWCCPPPARSRCSARGSPSTRGRCCT